MSMRTVGYRVSTGLVVLGLLAGGVADVSGNEQVVLTMQHLGYPFYVATLLGVWKMLGAAAIAAPRFPRLKEWAYAGVFFDLSGAVVSHIASADGVAAVAPPLVLSTLALLSWALRPESRALAASSLPLASYAPWKTSQPSPA